MRDFPVKIKAPNRRGYMTAKELANWANAVNRQAGGKAYMMCDVCGCYSHL